jgi:hypothetical protein
MIGELMAPVLVTAAMFALIGWGIWVGAENRTRRERIKAISELQHKLLDKFGAAGDLGQFVSSDAGRRFIESLETVKRVSTGRIVGSAQVGSVLTCLGLALVVLSLFYRFEEPVLPIMGAVILSLGLGFLVSAFVAHRLARSLANDEGNGTDLLRSDVA